MVPKKIREEYEKLKEEIEYHNYRYYVLADPIISDAEYDKLFKRLVEIEKKYPELVSPDSPTQRVGGKVLEYFEKVKHTIPMMSLDNTYDEKEIMEFDKRVKKLIGTDNVEYVCELKIDGVSISLRYENGILKQAVTRGDGITGDDVTENIKTVKSIPLRLREKLMIEVRGEIYMPSKEFERLNREREEQGLNVFANPRNATAGTLKLLDTSEVAKRHLDSFIYYIINPENFNIKTQWEALEFLRKIGFKVNPNNYLAKNIQEVIDYWKEWTEKKKELDYGADGVVVKVNSFEYQKILGETSRSPRWAIAFKFPAEQVTTKLINVVFQVGSTGIITPVAEFEPVFLEGTTVKRASLHNFDYIKDRDIRIGDFVVIEKAGGIIPQVVQVLKEKRTGEEKEITPPEKCPVCGGPVGKLNPEEVAIRCLNPFCKAKLKRNLELWASRDAMDIGGLGPKLIDRIVESKLIEDIADLYFLTPFDLATLGAGVKHKTIMNLLKQIEESKNRGLDRVLYGLGIPKVGKKLAKELAMKFGSIDKLMNAKLYELTSMEGIGEDIAESIIEFFSYEHTKKVIEKLKKAGVKLEATIKKTEGPLKGLTVCVTGELKGMSRSDFAKLIEEHGGTFTNNLTKKTHILVVGENPGSKLEKAKKLGIEVMKEEEFFKKFKLNLSEKRKNNKLSLF